MSQDIATPLSMHLPHATRLLLADLGFTSQADCQAAGIDATVLEVAYGSTIDDVELPNKLLAVISSMAGKPGLSEIVLGRFHLVAVDVLARWLDVPCSTAEEWEQRLVTVAGLAFTRPELWSVIYTIIYASPLKTNPLAFVDTANATEVTAERLHPILVAYLRLLVADSEMATRLAWPTAPLRKLIQDHPDAGVRLLAVYCIARQLRWGEAKREKMEQQMVGDVQATEARIVWDHKVQLFEDRPGFEVQAVVVDGWILPVLESRRPAAYKATLLQKIEASPEPTVSNHLPLLPQHLSPWTVAICDHLSLRYVPSITARHDTFLHVEIPATTAAARAILAKLHMSRPILISAPPSSGKSHIIQYISSSLRLSAQPTDGILTIPLADTTIDAKALIGSYVSSPTQPGTFQWMEGALTKAVRTGKWVVFEDIDRASAEVLCVISDLAGTLSPNKDVGGRARLAIASRDSVEAGQGFALFATRTVADVSQTAIFKGHHHFSEVHLAAPSDADVLAILSARFPRLAGPAASALVQIWQDLKAAPRGGGQVKPRDIGLRDLENWCARVERLLPAGQASMLATAKPFANPILQEEIFLEAVDVFVAAYDNRQAAATRRRQSAAIIATKLEMEEDRAISLLEKRSPALEISGPSQGPGCTEVRLGRACLAGSSRRPGQVEDSRPFALTRPSMILLEQIATATLLAEPTLLVGETGTGKTTAVQHLASLIRRPLTVLNLSMQTESGDLLGGFKPMDPTVSARSLQSRWQALFLNSFSMSRPQNKSYLETTAKSMSVGKWSRCTELWATSARRALEKIAKQNAKFDTDSLARTERESSPKKRKMDKGKGKAVDLSAQWQALLEDANDFHLLHVKSQSKLVFSFVEGPLVKALREGEWLLLDEVNLASQETLESIATVLEGATASVVLTERGDLEPVPRHPDFRLFACMNPATDVGKKDLPPALRSRFTEIYVPPPDDDRDALITIVAQYLGDAAAGDRSVILDIVELYSSLKALSHAKEIVDGSNAAPHYSMRTLARALSFAVQVAPVFGLRRGLWEGCLMAFTMSLDLESALKARQLCEIHLLRPMKNAGAALAQVPSLPAGASPDDFVRFGHFWLTRGSHPISQESNYIMTPSVEAKLSDLARVILTKRFPVLIQGPTSSGKTSAVEFLARRTGHRFVRINNHEHTDIQEYLGTYISDPLTGQLIFQEGLLVKAVREGHWIVLDELNLAPTDVLEALNRLLDDNRELVIPETQEVIRPHPNFMLFATQNPPGLYAGRKVLSRAFRNRFLEVHFDDVPKDELQIILCQRCKIAPSYAERIVKVFEELRHRRQSTRVFESKQSFATLRDLFRWAERRATGYQQLANDGYMLLAERARNSDDKVVIKEVLESIMKVTVNPDKLYHLDDAGPDSIMARLALLDLPSGKESGIIWTMAMQRLFILVAAAARHNEPVLLVGETGCGKTSVCEVIAQAFRQKLVSVNCHQNMETADLLGSQRPLRNRSERKAALVSRLQETSSILGLRDVPSPDASIDEIKSFVHEVLAANPEGPTEVLAYLHALPTQLQLLSALFEWSDGPLVHAMQDGDLLLLDEVSLADDSVLERLNSVLEPARTLVLAEKGGVDIEDVTVIASSGFQVVATMNPGGDFGKKELSPALRNRFTEIWVPSLNNRDDLLHIIGRSWQFDDLQPSGPLVLDFFDWFSQETGGSEKSGIGLRDILSWVSFSNGIRGQLGLNPASIFCHSGCMIIVDGLESLPQVAGMSAGSVHSLREACLSKLRSLAALLVGSFSFDISTPLVSLDVDAFRVDGFAIPLGLATVPSQSSFSMHAPTTCINALRVVRACQIPKAILLEGSPGVGKTSLVSALAAVTGHNLCRINLSDQTDLIDLFGSDLPVEGGKPGEFQWRDAAFLTALQNGDWVLLDEMNLASQTVLEGLNAVLDHRGTVFIPELGRAFQRHPDFRVFAAQNPLQQGGGRKGLPKSFLNRFTKVYLQEHTPNDLVIICQHLYPSLPTDTIQCMVEFNERMRIETMVTRTIGREGSPWEFNLRDLTRWMQLLVSPSGLEKTTHPVEHLAVIYTNRFRNDADRRKVVEIFQDVFGISVPKRGRPWSSTTADGLQVGSALLRRTGHPGRALCHVEHRPARLSMLESISKCVSMGWLVIIAGSNAFGKRTLIRQLAAAAGKPLGEFSMHPGVDTTEVLGSFEQSDALRSIRGTLRKLMSNLDTAHDELMRNRSDCSDVSALRDAVSKCLLDGVMPDVGPSLALATSALNWIKQYAALGDDTSALEGEVDAALLSGGSAASFDWIDGQLLTAIKTGTWYVISDANLCSPSVLDRLNSLCESNGRLVLSERGSIGGQAEVIIPHPGFRLFMLYDPKAGELSRAMRNRGIELALDQLESVGGLTDDRTAAHTMQSEIDSGVAHLEDHSYLQFAANLSAAAEGTAFIAPESAATLVAHVLTAQSIRGLVKAARLVGSLSPVHGAIALSLMAQMTSADMQEVIKGMQVTIRNGQHVPEFFSTSLSLDPSLNLHIRPSSPTSDLHTVARLLALNRLQQLHVDDLTAASNTSILSKSRILALKPVQREASSNNVQAVYPLATEARKVVASGIMNMLNSTVSFEHWEHLHVLIAELEEACNSSSFDFSAVEVIVKELVKVLAHLPDVSSLSSLVSALGMSVEIRTGLGQVQLWTALRPRVLSPSIHAKQATLCEKADRLQDLNLRQSVLQAIALADESTSDVVVSDLQQMVMGLPCLDDDPRAWSDLDTTNVMELGFLSRKESMNLGDLLQRLLNERTIHIIDLVNLSRVCVSADQPDLAEGLGVNPLLSAFQDWQARLWGGTDSLKAMNGPGGLMRPVFLQNVLRVTDCSSLRLHDIARQDIALRHAATAVDWQSKQDVSRIFDLVRLFAKSVLEVLAAFKSSFTSEHWEALYAATWSGSAFPALQVFISLVPLSSFAPLVTAFSRHLAADLARMLKLIQSKEDLLLLGCVGEAFVHLGLLLMGCYVTNVPIDPASRQQMMIRIVTSKIASLQAELVTVESALLRIVGELEHPRLSGLRDQATRLQAELAALGPAIRRDTAGPVALAEFFQEVHAFAADVFEDDKMEQLLSSLATSDDRSAAQREEAFQLSSQGFCRRLQSSYKPFADLSQPVLIAIAQAQLGLRCVARAGQLRRATLAPGLFTSAAAAISFPTITGAMLIEEMPLHGATAQALVLALAAQAYDSKGLPLANSVPRIANRYEHLFDLWSADRLREQRASMEAESLYRVRQTQEDVLSDPELEEREFSELFPTYEIEDDESPEPTAADQELNKQHGSAAVTAPLARQVYDLHLSFFGGDRHNQIGAARYRQMRGSLLSKALRDEPSAISNDFDDRSLAYQVGRLTETAAKLGASNTSSSYDFYRSENLPEVRRGYDLVTRLVGRLNEIIEEWPDQMVLQHMRERCEAILRLQLSSPVAQVLTSLERLLVHTDDWEAFANRDNTLRSYQKEISDLIVDWRRLELACWAHLLESQAEIYAGETTDWWFRLYGVVIHGAWGVASVAGDGGAAVSKHLQGMIPLLRTFIEQCTLGHFEARMHLLNSFVTFLEALAGCSHERAEGLRRIADTLGSLISFFDTYASKVRTSYTSQRLQVDKAIRDFIKLASWKDVNVNALKASALKSHRQLHKSIRKFRDILRQPVAPLLASFIETADATPITSSILPLVGEADLIDGDPPLNEETQASHLVKLASTYRRFASLNAESSAAITSQFAEDLDSFCTEIIETAESLAKETPSIATKENDKLIRNLATRKRKALSDLMKALRSMGLTFNVRADQLARQQNAVWLGELRPVKCPAWKSLEASPLVSKIEAYHQRMIALMPILRKSLTDHNSDITTRDLTRGIGFVESSFEKAVLGRLRLATLTKGISEITEMWRRLQVCASEGVVTGGIEAIQSLQTLQNSLTRVLDASQEAVVSCAELARLAGSPEMFQSSAAAYNGIIDTVQQLLQTLPGALVGLHGPVAMVTREDQGWASAAAEALEAAKRSLIANLEQVTGTKHLSFPLLAFISSISTSSQSGAPTTEPAQDLITSANELITALLVSAQKLPRDVIALEERPDLHLQTEEKRLQQTSQALSLDSVRRRLLVFVNDLANYAQQGAGLETVSIVLHRLLPFVGTYLNTAGSLAACEIDNTKVQYKVNYVLAKTMLNLAEKGFCKPSEEDRSKQQDGEGETSEGTGMGAGTGDKNVSDQIEDESQVEGLQGEKDEDEEDPKPENDQEGEDDAFDMEDDFEGEMADRDEKEDEDGDEDGERDDDHDEHVGDVDPLDPGAVDEKFWDEEKDEETKDAQDEQLDQKTEQTGESEMTAKDDKSKPEKDKKQSEPEEADSAEAQQPEAGEEQEDKEAPEGASDDGQQESENGEDEPEQRRNPDEVAMPEADNLNLPDLPDLDLDGDDAQDDRAEDDGMDLDLDEDEGEDPQQSPGEDVGEASDDDGDAANDADDPPDASAPTEEEAIDTDPVTTADLDMSESKDQQNQEASADGGQKGDDASGVEQPKADEQEKGDQREVEDDKEATEKEESSKGAAPAPDAGSAVDDVDDEGGAEGESGAPQAATADGRPQASRSLGDIMKEIRRRRDEILNQADDMEQPAEQSAPNQAQGQVEYLKEDDEQEEDAQALGPAGEEEQQKLSDLNIVDDDDERSNPDVAMENDDAVSPSAAEAKSADFSHQDSAAGGENKAEQALTQAQVEATKRQAAEGEVAMDVDEDEAALPTLDQPADIATAEVEATMRDWVATGRPDDSGEAIWRLYSSLTSDLSFALCEQLRLILEPTLATRLQGDFRTGKRLNMRKIIPYIASEFTKDKIWLRRTKPSKREYQVLLSLDDSRSMAESHSVHLAYQTLALVSQALNKLEVGQVSIARFGEGVEILHPFGDSGFTDADGAKVMSAFKFDQHRTDVAALVERSLDTLAAARQASTSSSPDLWQLEIIISDGVCQDHSRLRALLRRALEERVMIVFLIVDSLGQASASSATQLQAAAPAARTSILSMQSVAYKQVNGEMQIEMERYLDTFPFDYYVVLRDVEALPNVLAETLRQWMSRVAESNE